MWTMKIILGIGILALLGPGCGADCESLCEESRACSSFDGDTNTSCGQECDQAEAFMEAFGCADQYDEMMTCAGDLDDICQIRDMVTTPCAGPSDALGTCMGDAFDL